MERPEIIEILIESLHQPPENEQLVAYAFLRDILTRRGEPLSHRARIAFHLALFGARRFIIRAAGCVRNAGSSARRVPSLARDLLRSSLGAVVKGFRLSRLALLAALIAAANGLSLAWEAAGLSARSLTAALAAVRSAVSDILAGLLAVIAAAFRTLHAAFAAVCSAVINTVRMALVLVLFTLAGAAGTVIHVFVQITDAVRFFVLLTAFSIAGAQTAVLSRYNTARYAVRAAYLSCRRAVLTIVSRTSDRTTRAYRFVRMVVAEVKRQATRQVLPQGTTPFIAAGLVCLVLFVFGINSYFVISDTNKKGIFIDLSRYEWGDEALASILIGEGYDIYLNEKITEKRIRELLESGQYYERIIRVTGYYSPLPDQKKYATGSYRGDIILNGRGIMGSDTTPVYIGMAAGPPHMEFGTNVIIEDLGKFNLPKIYTVHDRGGAINGNRLDIWVGKGEEAMKKAYEITGYYKVIVVGDK